MKTNRWGWFSYFPYSESTIAERSEKIWSGAGRNRIDKAFDIGTVVYTYDTTETPTITIEIVLNSGVKVTEYHAYVGDKPAEKAAAPGSYSDIQYPEKWESESWEFHRPLFMNMDKTLEMEL